MRREYISEDITYCASDCSLTSCFRNRKNIRQMIPHSFALFEGTEECLKFEKVHKVTPKRRKSNEERRTKVDRRR